MGWSQKQIAWVHQWAQVAGLMEEDYRSLLRETTRASSSADEKLDRTDFEAMMRALEREFFAAVSEGFLTLEELLGKIADPVQFTRRHVLERGSKSDSRAREKTAESIASPAQLAKISALQKDLTPYFHEVREHHYLAAIVAKRFKGNGGGFVSSNPAEWSTAQASCVINALLSKQASLKEGQACIPIDAPPPVAVTNALADAAVEYDVARDDVIPF